MGLELKLCSSLTGDILCVCKYPWVWRRGQQTTSGVDFQVLSTLIFETASLIGLMRTKKCEAG